MAESSPKRVSFEDGHSSPSDEDRTPLEVVFDESNPYRRKSSLVADDSIPPHLRRAPPISPKKTECLVHQFLANQRKAKFHLPTHPRHRDRHDAGTHVHHGHAGTTSCEANDISSEVGLDRPLDPKNGHVDGRSPSPKPSGSQDHDHHGKLSKDYQPQLQRREKKGQDEPFRPHATILRDSRTASEVDESNGTSGNSSATDDHGPGQFDEKHWRRSMVGDNVGGSGSDDGSGGPASGGGNVDGGVRGPVVLSRTPSQLDERSASDEAPNSRLLTKKQLSEMAWGVRELSRRLGSMRLKFRVKSIFLLTKIYDTELIGKTRELCRWLLDRQRDVRYTVYVDRELKENKKFDVAGLLEEVRRDYVVTGEVSEEASWDIAKRLRYWDEAMCRGRPHTFDFVITLGGDGTVLYASWLFQRIVPPVLSFALGSLGFLTKFDFEDYQKTLTNAFSEGVTVSLRLRFEVTVMRSQKTRSRLKQDGQHTENVADGDDERPPRDLVEELIGEEKDDEHTHRPDGTYEVLNEVVVDRGPNPTMSNVDIFGDDEHFTSVSADGVCVSTPTGSTAYNLAAGGSLCHPENPVMLVTSICAHTLSFRPVILPDTIVLRIGVPYDARTSSWASFDGRERVELTPGDYVTVSASRYPFACVQPHGRRSEDWINSISAKLGWNTRQRQKSFKAWEK
ncbi:ATP-NAD kinase-like domain-containing protein [Corynascus similis CBS 632.67]